MTQLVAYKTFFRGQSDDLRTDSPPGVETGSSAEHILRKFRGEVLGPWTLGARGVDYDEATGRWTVSVFDRMGGQVIRHSAQWRPSDQDLERIRRAPETEEALRHAREVLKRVTDVWASDHMLVEVELGPSGAREIAEYEALKREAERVVEGNERCRVYDTHHNPPCECCGCHYECGELRYAVIHTDSAHPQFHKVNSEE